MGAMMLTETAICCRSRLLVPPMFTLLQLQGPLQVDDVQKEGTAVCWSTGQWS